MLNITLKMRDGSTREFTHQPRAGGSWNLSLRYEPGFVVVADEWDKETAVPTDLIAEIVQTPERYL